MKYFTLFISLVIITFLAGIGTVEASTSSASAEVRSQDLVIGNGVAASRDDVLTIHFVVWVDNNGNRGKMIFSSYEQNTPVTFKLGTERVIAGWNIGIAGMQTGGKRILYVPAEFAYGNTNLDESIPAPADLIYEVELIEIR